MQTNGSNPTVKIGVIGCGGRIRGVLGNILKAAPEGRLRITAAYDTDPLSYEALEKDFGGGWRRCASEEALARDPEVDWVFIGSWNSQHALQAILALKAGKHVFCEKPLATSLEDCLAIREAVAKSGRTFAFGLVLRYSPHYQRIREVLDSGVLGRLVSFEFNETLGFNHGGYIFGNWRRSRANAGTHLLEKCCHDLDLANWFAGALPVRAASFGGRDFFKPEEAGAMRRVGQNENGIQAYCEWADPHRVNPFEAGADILDNQVCIIEYGNGVRCTFHTNCNTAIPERRFYICGTEGTLRADLHTGTLEVKRIGWETKVEKIDTGADGGHGGGDEEMAARMARVLLEGAAPLAGVEEGIRSAVAAFGIDQAADEGRVTDLLPLWKQAGINPRA